MDSEHLFVTAAEICHVDVIGIAKLSKISVVPIVRRRVGTWRSPKAKDCSSPRS